METIPFMGFTDPVSSISHLVTSFLFFIASFFLIYRGRGNSGRVIGLLIYCFCLILLFSMSGVYHLLSKGSTARHVLHILDYVAIFTLIAGTITPIHLILFRGIHRWLVLTVVWSLAITGISLTSVFFTVIPEWIILSFFLGLGWFGLGTVWGIYKVHNRKLMGNLIVGGLFYTLGAIAEYNRWPLIIDQVLGPHEIFHFFVILGAFFHWKLVYKIAKYPISSAITIIVTEYPDNKFYAKATSENRYFTGKSKEEVKKNVLNWVESKFHKDMKPHMINFKYRQEDTIYLNE
jgi:channel protein (hemolysin III family)